MKPPFRSFIALLGLISAAQVCFAIQMQLLPAGTVLPEPLSVSAGLVAAQPDPAVGSAADDSQYSDGTRAIHESRWSDAAAIFGKVAGQRTDHAEGALYWKAYAENKLGLPDRALATCTELRQNYPASRWLDECGALEIEIHGAAGHPVEPGAEHDEDLKLLALNTLMQKDEARALPEIQQILSGSQPEKFKERALFVLAQSNTPQAKQMLGQVANNAADPDLQSRAAQLLATSHPMTSAHAQTRRIGIDLVVTDTQGQPVTGVTAADLTLLDNGQPKPFVTFHSPGDSPAGGGGKLDPPTEVIIFIDTINESIIGYPYMRDEVETFLKSDGGKLAHPVSLYIFDGIDTQRLAPPSQDGNALAAILQNAGLGERPIRHSSPASELVRAQISLARLGALAVEKATTPGRKVLLWISPGWDIFNTVDDWMMSYEYVRRDEAPLFKTRKSVFDAIVALSTGLRQARIQLYCIKPNNTPGTGSLEFDRYKSYLKPALSPDKLHVADLALQVLAVQSGGLAVFSTSDYLNGVIAKTLAAAEADYFVSFETAPATRKDEYHDLKVTVNKPGLIARTRAGYYNQP
jgi:VWFA-related protein